MSNIFRQPEHPHYPEVKHSPTVIRGDMPYYRFALLIRCEDCLGFEHTDIYQSEGHDCGTAFRSVMERAAAVAIDRDARELHARLNPIVTPGIPKHLFAEKNL